jgi:hypothetical protein
MAINHTSETQLESWEELIQTAYQIYRTFARSMTADDARDFWLKVTGWHSDHAEDQKKLFWLVTMMKERLEQERRGERVIAQMVPAQWVDLIFEVTQDAVAAVGGISAWEKLGDAEHSAHHIATLAEFVRHIGQEDFDKLPDEEKQDVDLFIWGGCCMHKSMNVFNLGIFMRGRRRTSKKSSPNRNC